MRNVNKVLFMVFLILCTGIALGAEQDNASLREKVFNAKYLNVPNKDIMINFNSEKFYLKWSNFSHNVSMLEFLKESETVDNYEQMITVVTPGESVSFKDYIAMYLKQLKPYQDQPPKIFRSKDAKYEEEVIIDILLLDIKREKVEHVLAKIFVDDNKHVNSIVLSSVVKFSAFADNPDILKEKIGKNREQWMKSLDKVYFISFE